MSQSSRTQLAFLSQKYNIAIREDKQIEHRLLQNLAREYSSTRSGVHVSDLTLCLRQAVFRKIHPQPLDTRQLSYFFDGSRRHESLQELYSSDDPAHVVAEKKGTFEDVSYSIDIYHNIPIEFKTTRASRAISEHWIRQLAYYMLASNSNIGILQIQRLLPNESEEIFPAYLIEFTNEQERIVWLNDFRLRKSIMQEALIKNDPSVAPTYRGERNWVCKDCPHKAQCDSIESSLAIALPGIADSTIVEKRVTPGGGSHTGV